MSPTSISEIIGTVFDDAPSADVSTAPQRPPKLQARADVSKAEIVVKKLRLARGVTVAQIIEATGWQPHSVRGFLSGVVRKKLMLNLISEVGKDGQRRYRVVDDTAKGAV